MKILIVEDNQFDAKLALQTLKTVFTDLETKVVETIEDFLTALSEFNPDLVITDFTLPNFDGMTVVKLTNQHNKKIPVIIFTGSINEEVAVECIKSGATDYVLKDRYQKLPYSVREALEKIEAINQKEEAEKRLRESEALFRTLAEASQFGIYLISVKDFKFSYVNQGFLKIFGYSRNEVVQNLNPFDLVDEPSKELAREVYESKISGRKKTTNAILSCKNKNGQQIFVEIFSTIISIDNREYILGAVIDVTQRIIAENEVKKSELLFRTIWENSSDAMRIVNENGNVIRVNKAYCELFEKEENELIGQPFYTVYDQSSINDYINSFVQSVKHDKIPFEQEMEMMLWNKKKIYLEARNKILLIDGKKYILTILRDMTERKQYEMELIKAKDEALEMSRVKSNFLANMSHEIRTPLNGMIGFSDILRERLDCELKDWAEIIYGGSMRLLETLDTILDFTKIEADKVMPYIVEFDAVEVTHEVVKLFEKAAEKKKINLEFKCEQEKFVVRCDEKLFRRIISNLINNAVKFTLEGGVIVTLFEDNEYLVFKVSDNGIGIPEDKLHLIFEEFRQVSEGLGREFEGTGLGLTIVRKYVEKLNGKITVQSKVGEGSTFTVYLPKMI